MNFKEDVPPRLVEGTPEELRAMGYEASPPSAYRAIDGMAVRVDEPSFTVLRTDEVQERLAEREGE